MVEKTYNLRITERELKNPVIRKHLLALVEMRLKLQRHKDKLTISKVEYSFIRHHYSWRKVEDYLPKQKGKLVGKFPGEVGKYNGKRVVVRGMK